MTHRQQFGQRVQELMGKHDLFSMGWDYSYDRAKKRLGCCHFGPKLLTFSLPYIDINEIEVMENTILHEIAHVLAGPRANHSWEWKLKARQIGALPQRCNGDPRIKQPVGDYVFMCGCGPHYMHRRTTLGQRFTCRKCKVSGIVTQTSI